eukprot:g615.t1
MNSDGQQLLPDSSQVEVVTDNTTQILEDKRSAHCSDYMNNRNMSGGDQGPVYPTDTTSTQDEVATWLESTQSPLNGQHSVSVETEKETSVFENLVDDSSSPQELVDGVTEIDADADVADKYQEWLMIQEAKIREDAVQGAQRFSVQDIMNNPDLENAAKLELAPKLVPPVVRPPLTPQASNADSMISLAESRVSRLEHMLSVSEDLDRDAEKDTQVGANELQNLLGRLKFGKTACTGLLNLVQKLYRTETMYCASLLECSRPNVINLGETVGFREATDLVCELPMKIRGAHTMVAQTLAGSATQLDTVLKKISSLVKELESYPTTVAKDMKTKKLALCRSKIRHEVLCRKLEKLNEDEVAANHAARDPWFTEGEVAHNYTRLVEGQANVRKMLSIAYQKVKEMEVQRLQTSKDVIALLLHTYGCSIDEVVTPFTRGVIDSLSEIAVEDEVEDLKRNGETSQQSEQQLRSQCSEEEMMKCHEIFHSPDILNQGSLQLLNKDEMLWVTGHFVLTRAGLYWFLHQNEGSRPDDFISLSKTDLEQVKAPLFKLKEKGGTYLGGARSVVLRAATVEECFNWTVDLREAIAHFAALRK